MASVESTNRLEHVANVAFRNLCYKVAKRLDEKDSDLLNQFKYLVAKDDSNGYGIPQDTVDNFLDGKSFIDGLKEVKLLQPIDVLYLQFLLDECKQRDLIDILKEYIERLDGVPLHYQPCSDLANGKISDPNCGDISKALEAGDFSRLCCQLGLKPSDIEKVVNVIQDSDLKNRAVLRHWRKTNGNKATRKAILEALEECELIEAKEELEKKWKVDVTFKMEVILKKPIQDYNFKHVQELRDFLHRLPLVPKRIVTLDGIEEGSAILIFQIPKRWRSATNEEYTDIASALHSYIMSSSRNNFWLLDHDVVGVNIDGFPYIDIVYNELVKHCKDNLTNDQLRKMERLLRTAGQVQSQLRYFLSVGNLVDFLENTKSLSTHNIWLPLNYLYRVGNKGLYEKFFNYKKKKMLEPIKRRSNFKHAQSGRISKCRKKERRIVLEIKRSLEDYTGMDLEEMRQNIANQSRAEITDINVERIDEGSISLVFRVPPTCVDEILKAAKSNAEWLTQNNVSRVWVDETPIDVEVLNVGAATARVDTEAAIPTNLLIKILKEERVPYYIRKQQANGVIGGKPMLSWATEVGELNWVEGLLDSGADVNATDQNKATVLHMTSFFGSAMLTNRFLKCPGINTHTSDVEGNTALSIAEGQCHDSIIKVLKEHEKQLELERQREAGEQRRKAASLKEEQDEMSQAAKFLITQTNLFENIRYSIRKIQKIARELDKIAERTGVSKIFGVVAVVGGIAAAPFTAGASLGVAGAAFACAAGASAFKLLKDEKKAAEAKKAIEEIQESTDQIKKVVKDFDDSCKRYGDRYRSFQESTTALSGASQNLGDVCPDALGSVDRAMVGDIMVAGDTIIVAVVTLTNIMLGIIKIELESKLAAALREQVRIIEREVKTMQRCFIRLRDNIQRVINVPVDL